MFLFAHDSCQEKNMCLDILFVEAYSWECARTMTRERQDAMAGQIIKRGNRQYLVRIFQGRDAQGKRRYVNKTIRGTKKDADKYLSKTLTAMSTGTYIEASTLSVDDYLDRWLQNAAKGRGRERPFDDYSDLLKRYVRPALGKTRLCDLRPLDIQNLYTDMQASDLSARTFRYTHAVLNSARKP